MSRYRKWPLAPQEPSYACWFYIRPRGLEVYVQHDEASPTKPRNATIPWKYVFSAIGHYRRSRRSREEK